MSLLLALTGSAVTADLSVTDSADVLDALAGVLVDASLSVSDSSDTLTATATVSDAEAVSLGGRNKLFDVPARRVRADLSVTDDDDQVYATAKVAQVLRVVKAQILSSPVTITHAVLDDADTLQATAKATWPERHMLTEPKRKLVSSRYESATT